MKIINLSGIVKFVKNNKWIIISSIFFLAWKFFLVGILWQNRALPPEPDDSLIYTGFIKSVKDCTYLICEYPFISMKNYVGFLYLPYRLFLGITAKIYDVDPINMFHYSFYIGYVILVAVLISFLSTLTKNKRLIGLSLFFLALYNGSGLFHGFFWVAPAFFAVVVFLGIFSIILNPDIKRFWLWALILTPILVFIHPSGIYSFTIYIFFYLIYSFFSHDWQMLIFKKTALIIAIAIVSYLPLFFYLNFYSQGNPWGVKNVVGRTLSESKENVFKTSNDSQEKVIVAPPIKPDVKTINLFPGYRDVYESYFLWIFPHWLGVLIFIFVLLVLVYFKKTMLISIYFSSLIFVLLSTLNQYGYRSVAYLWPITYILYAFGVWYAFKLLPVVKNKFLCLVLKIAFSAATLGFILLNIIYSYAWNQYSNQRDNIIISDEAYLFLEKEVKNDQSVFYGDKFLHSFSLNTGMINYYNSKNKDGADYLIYQTLISNPNCQSGNLLFESFLNNSSKILKINRKPSIQAERKKNDTEGFYLYKNIDNIEIYKKID
ncbi:MAG: hypothetical protein PHQ20_02830 [Candidatus Moranbacteria bacterium]|nr:hypothetical protein [Candidatus Moranbacteria bacterium]